MKWAKMAFGVSCMVPEDLSPQSGDYHHRSFPGYQFEEMPTETNLREEPCRMTGRPLLETIILGIFTLGMAVISFLITQVPTPESVLRAKELMEDWCTPSVCFMLLIVGLMVATSGVLSSSSGGKTQDPNTLPDSYVNSKPSSSSSQLDPLCMPDILFSSESANANSTPSATFPFQVAPSSPEAAQHLYSATLIPSRLVSLSHKLDEDSKEGKFEAKHLSAPELPPKPLESYSSRTVPLSSSYKLDEDNMEGKFEAKRLSRPELHPKPLESYCPRTLPLLYGPIASSVPESAPEAVQTPPQHLIRSYSYSSKNSSATEPASRSPSSRVRHSAREVPNVPTSSVMEGASQRRQVVNESVVTPATPVENTAPVDVAQNCDRIVERECMDLVEKILPCSSDVLLEPPLSVAPAALASTVYSPPRTPKHEVLRSREQQSFIIVTAGASSPTGSASSKSTTREPVVNTDYLRVTPAASCSPKAVSPITPRRKRILSTDVRKIIKVASSTPTVASPETPECEGAVRTVTKDIANVAISPASSCEPSSPTTPIREVVFDDSRKVTSERLHSAPESRKSPSFLMRQMSDPPRRPSAEVIVADIDVADDGHENQDTDDDVDQRVEAFLKSFREQMRMQMEESVLRYKNGEEDL